MTLDPERSSPMRRPVLSVLIPTYNYAEGLLRILNRLPVAGSPSWEIVVSDDSTTDDVASAIAPLLGHGGIAYSRNVPPLGASANWNALLDRATGDYCLLLHHDEYPATPDFLPALIRELGSDNPPDVLILDCLIADSRSGRTRRHVDGLLRLLVARRFPEYLFTRNVIGPTSAVVARRSLYPRFDGALRWLVDVDAYYRLLRAARAVSLSETAVASIVGRTDSITASLGRDLGELRDRERRYLATKYPALRLLAMTVGTSLGHRAARVLESAAWASYRAASRSLARLPGCQRSDRGERS